MRNTSEHKVAGHGTFSFHSMSTTYIEQMAADHVTLHEEIANILRHRSGAWMTTTEIAKEVSRRGIYKKRDGTSDVTAYQIHGRTKNYPHLFKRDGIRVRLINN